MGQETDLFGAVPEPAYKGKEPYKYRPKPNGYGGIPGTGPEGETCGTCKHHVILEYAKRYHKCGLNRARWTHGTVTDIRVRSPACSRWEQDDEED